MDGDIPDLPKFIEVKKKHGAMLLVDGPGNGYPDLDGFLYVALIAAKPWTDANPELATRTVRAFVRISRDVASNTR